MLSSQLLCEYDGSVRTVQTSLQCFWQTKKTQNTLTCYSFGLWWCSRLQWFPHRSSRDNRMSQSGTSVIHYMFLKVMHFWLSLYLSFFTPGYLQKQHSQATYVTEKPTSWAPCRLWSTKHFKHIWFAAKCNLADPDHLCPNGVRYTSCEVKRNKRKLQCRKYKKNRISATGLTCYSWL